MHITLILFLAYTILIAIAFLNLFNANYCEISLNCMLFKIIARLFFCFINSALKEASLKCLNIYYRGKIGQLRI